MYLNIDEGKISNFINKARDTYRYMTGKSDTKTSFNDKAYEWDLDDISDKNIKDYISDIKESRPVEIGKNERKGLLKVVLDVTDLASEKLARAVMPASGDRPAGALYDYLDYYNKNNNQATFVFPIQPGLSDSQDSDNEKEKDDDGLSKNPLHDFDSRYNDAEQAGFESVMTPTPIPYKGYQVDEEGHLVKDKSLEESWTKVDRKTVYDSDGFTTDYTWYEDDNGHHVFIFGDSDLYSPEDTEPDWEADSWEEAKEWFDDYKGFEDEEEYHLELNEEIVTETPGLTLSDPKVTGPYLEIDINGKRYTYKVRSAADSANDIATTVSKMKKYSDGKALAYLKKNMELVQKETVEEESLEEALNLDDAMETKDYKSYLDFLLSHEINRNSEEGSFRSNVGKFVFYAEKWLQDHGYRFSTDRKPFDKFFTITYHKDRPVEESVTNSDKKVSFKDVHKCTGCGKPLSQCTCKISEEEESVEESLNEDLTHDEEDILKVVVDQFGTVDEPYKGPSFILPDGKLLDLRNVFYHSDVEKFLIDKGYSEGPYSKTTGSPTLKNLGCVRCDTSKYYVTIPETNITSAQINTLLVWLDFLSKIHKTVEVISPSNHVVYQLNDETNSDHIVDMIRRYYSAGQLYEIEQAPVHQNGFVYERKPLGEDMMSGATQPSSIGQHKIDDLSDNEELPDDIDLDIPPEVQDLSSDIS